MVTKRPTHSTVVCTEDTGEVLSRRPDDTNHTHLLATPTDPCYVPPEASRSTPSTRGWCGTGIEAEACCVSGRWYRCKDLPEHHPGVAWALYNGQVFASKMVAPHLLDEEVSTEGDVCLWSEWYESSD